MPVEESVDPSVPAQWRAHTIYDFRNMPDGPRGYKVQVTKKGHLGSKRKLDEYTEQVRMHVSDFLFGMTGVDPHVGKVWINIVCICLM